MALIRSENGIVIKQIEMMSLSAAHVFISFEKFRARAPISEVGAGLVDGSIAGLVVILSAFIAGLTVKAAAFAAFLTLSSVAITNF